MTIINWAVKRPITVIMLICFILLMGMVAIFMLPIDLLPKMNIPVAMINTQYPGAGPQEVENLITKPLEAAVAMVHNVKRITSTSSEGNSRITIEFFQNTDMDFAALEIREKIDLVKGYLPEDTIDPMVLKVDPNALPIMNVGIGGDKELVSLQEIAENIIQPRLERIPGVASVSLSGGAKEEIHIVVDPLKLQALGTNLQQLMTLLRAENINLPTGEITDGQQQRLTRFLGEFQSLEDLEGLPLLLPNGAVVPLKDLAQINRVLAGAQEITKMDGKPSVRLTIQKQSVANTVKVADSINQELKRLQEELDGITIRSMADQSVYIKNSISNVGKTAIYGGILAVVVLFLFLRNYRSTLIIALSIPISVFATFALMYFSDITLNLLSLAGFALGVGMLVDNGIVVLENIYRYRETGSNIVDAAIHGTREVSAAIGASTLTSVAVFLPIVFVQGMTAQIFRELALTVTYALLASLLVSITLVPMLSARLLKQPPEDGVKKEHIFFRFFDRIMSKIFRGYKIILAKGLKHRGWVLAFSAIFLLASVGALFRVGAEYFPEFDEGTFTVDVRLPHGATLEQTKALVQEIEVMLRQQKEVESLFSTVGTGGSSMMSASTQRNRGTIDGELVPQNQRKKSTGEVMDEIRGVLAKIPGAEITVTANSSVLSMGFGGDAVEVEVRGDDLDTLKKISEDIVNIVQGIVGTREVATNYIEGPPQYELVIDRQAAARYGLQGGQIASIIRSLVQGTTATRLKLAETELDVVVKGPAYFREGLGSFMQIPLITPLGVGVPLEHVISIQRGTAPSTIRHSDQARAISVSAAILNRDLNTVVQEIQKKLSDYDFPAGYSYAFRGQQELLEEAFNSLILVVILAILLVYMILASQFQSLIHPFTIMLSVPLAFAGGAIALLLTSRPLSVPGLIGAVVLAGIVVNNGIVLIDYILVLRERGFEREEAIMTAGNTRLRPILMTTSTTVLGLLPLALGIGEGAEAQAPMATVVIGGLISATFLTLVVIPVIYSIFDDLMVKKNSA